MRGLEKLGRYGAVGNMGGGKGVGGGLGRSYRVVYLEVAIGHKKSYNRKGEGWEW